MNVNDVIKVERQGYTSYLYSYDGGYTRHAVEINRDGQSLCRLNESRCFPRGTHQLMARLHGINLNAAEPQPFTHKREQK